MSSPDPLTLPSSPLARHTRHRSASIQPSPTKSIILEPRATTTTTATSPWRIKVTVEDLSHVAQPSPRIKREMQPSAVKRVTRRVRTKTAETEESEPASKRRKGTPVRRYGRLRPKKEDDEAVAVAVMSSSPKHPPSSATRRRSMVPLPYTGKRTQRLSQARDELDWALREALGEEDGVTHANEEEEDEDEEAAGDMTFVSISSLQSVRGLTVPRDGNVGDKSGLSVSYLPSSPPSSSSKRKHEVGKGDVMYPVLPVEGGEEGVMSWKATGLATTLGSRDTRTLDEDDEPEDDGEPSEWRRERLATSRRIQEASTSQVITVPDDRTEAAISDSDDDSTGSVAAGAEQEEDLWQEEASRSSLLETHSRQDISLSQIITESRATHEAEMVRPPRRAKIPRTWRRSSGADFAYSDSPRHVVESASEEVAERMRGGEGARKVSAGSDAGSGVLTPPSSGDEEVVVGGGDATIGEGAMEEGRVGEEQEEEESVLGAPDFAGTQMDVHASSNQEEYEEEAEGEDEVTLGAAAEPSTAFSRPQPRPRTRIRPQRRAPMDLNELLGLQSSPAKPAPEPPTAITEERTPLPQHSRLARLQQPPKGRDVSSSLVSESFQSKASDQRQLLAEMGDASSFHQQSTEPSYEEHLNVESPRKIRVNFNDSSSSLLQLQPGRRVEHGSLFGRSLVPTQQAAPTQQTKPADPSNLIARFTSTLWTAALSLPQPSLPALFTQTTPAPYVYPVALRTSLRSRYGVLPSTHPWTMAHVRTLHRMHNSLTSGASDSIMPSSGPLPPSLLSRVGKVQASVMGFDYDFSEQNAHVVAALMTVLVDEGVVRAMERGEVEELGDATARGYRGLILGRRGGDLVWTAERRVGTLDEAWVVRCLGDVIAANAESARKQQAQA